MALIIAASTAVLASAFARQKRGAGLTYLGSMRLRAPSSVWVFSIALRRERRKGALETLRYTHADRFPKLPGYHTFTSHWHMAIADAAIKREKEGTAPATPDFVAMFKGLGVDIVHLAEFHGDGHPNDPGPLRLPELRTMFRERERLSDKDLLFLPGEEANSYLGSARPGKEAGHWPYLFPKPVYWTMNRAKAQPFTENIPPFGLSTMSAPVTTCKTSWSAKEASYGRPMPASRARAGPRTAIATAGSSAPITGWGPPGRPCLPTCRKTSSAAGCSI